METRTPIVWFPRAQTLNNNFPISVKFELSRKPGHAEPRLVALASLLADDDTARLVLVVEDLLDVLLLLLVDHLGKWDVDIQLLEKSKPPSASPCPSTTGLLTLQQQYRFPPH